MYSVSTLLTLSYLLLLPSSRRTNADSQARRALPKRWDATRRMGRAHHGVNHRRPPASFLSASRYAL
jgi:hypothetical protein